MNSKAALQKMKMVIYIKKRKYERKYKMNVILKSFLVIHDYSLIKLLLYSRMFVEDMYGNCYINAI